MWLYMIYIHKMKIQLENPFGFQLFLKQKKFNKNKNIMKSNKIQMEPQSKIILIIIVILLKI